MPITFTSCVQNVLGDAQFSNFGPHTEDVHVVEVIEARGLGIITSVCRFCSSLSSRLYKDGLVDVKLKAIPICLFVLLPRSVCDNRAISMHLFDSVPGNRTA